MFNVQINYIDFLIDPPRRLIDPPRRLIDPPRRLIDPPRRLNELKNED